MVSSQKMLSGEATCDDIIQCLFSLNKFENAVLQKLHEKGSTRSDELAEELGKDRSTIHRALQKLLSCGLCYKETNTIPQGGYYHVYTAIPAEQIKKKAEDCIDLWYKNMKTALGDFENLPWVKKSRTGRNRKKQKR